MNTNTQPVHKRYQCPCCGAKLSASQTGSACVPCGLSLAHNEISALRHDYFWSPKLQRYQKNERAASFSEPPAEETPDSILDIADRLDAQRKENWRVQQ